ncbi:MAG: HNH endonuclease [Methylococcaceae bacterium]|nr:HNH endonuclease [Methylococcaceae bacterium]
MNIVHAELKEFLYYDGADNIGVFTWLKRNGRGNRNRVGGIAGSLDKVTGYITIRIMGKNYQAHRLAWFYIHGIWPKSGIDHRDTIKHHNWLSNLREATQQQNTFNAGIQKNNNSGYKGVSWNAKRQKWIAQVGYNKKSKYLGGFDTAEEAAAQYLIAAKKLHGDFLHHSLVDKLCKLL